jgi:hypothetical protein
VSFKSGVQMKTFYTVDRAGALFDGAVIDIVKHDDISPKNLQIHVDSLFPNGVSSHGDRYFLKNDSHGQITSAAIELLFEYVRRANFSGLPSRFESLFACETIEDALKFRSYFGKPSDSIFEVFSDRTSFKGNMALLDNNQTSLVCSYFADEYWNGNQGPLTGCFWEVLLELPVKIGKQIG